jgi:hypothetical protein
MTKSQRLINAAPDLLASLEEILGGPDHRDYPSLDFYFETWAAIIQRAEAAVSKARGRKIKLNRPLPGGSKP